LSRRTKKEASFFIDHLQHGGERDSSVRSERPRSASRIGENTGLQLDVGEKISPDERLEDESEAEIDETLDDVEMDVDQEERVWQEAGEIAVGDRRSSMLESREAAPISKNTNGKYECRHSKDHRFCKPEEFNSVGNLRKHESRTLLHYREDGKTIPFRGCGCAACEDPLVQKAIERYLRTHPRAQAIGNGGYRCRHTQCDNQIKHMTESARDKHETKNLYCQSQENFQCLKQ